MDKNKIDVHIIVHPTQDRSEYLDPLLKQLEFEPVRVHLIPGVKGLIGEGRYQGYKRGNSLYKAYLDDDDSIVPGIFDKILECFEQEDRIHGCCTREQDADTKGINKFPFRYYDPFHCFHIHHITTYKYTAIEPYLETIRDCPETAEHTLAALLLINNKLIKHVPEVGYIYRRHNIGISSDGIKPFQKSKDIYKQLSDQVAKNNNKSVIEGQDSIARYNRMS